MEEVSILDSPDRKKVKRWLLLRPREEGKEIVFPVMGPEFPKMRNEPVTGKA